MSDEFVRGLQDAFYGERLHLARFLHDGASATEEIRAPVFAPRPASSIWQHEMLAKLLPFVSQYEGHDARSETHDEVVDEKSENVKSESCTERHLVGHVHCVCPPDGPAAQRNAGEGWLIAALEETSGETILAWKQWDASGTGNEMLFAATPIPTGEDARQNNVDNILNEAGAR